MCCWRSRSPCHHWERHQVGARLGSAGTHLGWAPRVPAGQAGVTPAPCAVSRSQTYCIENAHGQLVRDLDFNPNKQYYLASCGDDCKVKFWDTRNVTEPVKTLEEHSHW